MELTGFSLSIVDGNPSIVASPHAPTRVDTFIRRGGAWNVAPVDEAVQLSSGSSTWEGDVPWILVQDDSRMIVRRGSKGPIEMLPGKHLYARDIAVDRHGQPHVCYSTEADHADHLVYAHRESKPGSSWTIEKLPVDAQRCELLVANDGVHVLTKGSQGISVFSRSGSAWQSELLTRSSYYTSVAGDRSPTGEAVIVLLERGRFTRVTRSGDSWTRTSMAIDVGTETAERLELAIDRTNKAHVVFQATRPGTPGEILYASEGSTISRVADDQARHIELTLDANDRPHIAYASSAKDRYPLVYARQRPDTSRPRDTDVLIESTDTIVHACALLVAVQLGEAPPDASNMHRARRWCAYDASLPSIAQLEERCRTRDRDACLLGAALASNTQGLNRLDLRHDRCRDRGPKARCWGTYRSASSIGLFKARGNDEQLAAELFARACKLGAPAACVQVATMELRAGRSAVELYLDACTPEFPLACSAALDLMILDADLKKRAVPVIRAALESACAKLPMPEGCNALAYMEEAGLGGPVRIRDALRHHQRACINGSATSCTRLLVGPLPKSRAPKGLDPETFRQALEDACSTRTEDACFALALAFERGWAVEKDPDAGRRVLEDACDESVPSACKRIGRSLPAEEQD